MANWKIMWTSIFVNVMSLCYADPIPDPDPGLILQVNQVVKMDQCCPKGCVFGDTEYPDGALIEDNCMILQCCDGAWKNTGNIDTTCCVFRDTLYPDGALIEDTCMILQCIDGAWNYTGNITKTCGECQAWGDPHFLTFDPHLNLQLLADLTADKYYYIFNGNGSGIYTITQHGLIDTPEFGLSSTFEQCFGGVSCVRSINYHEPGFNVNVTFPSFQEDSQCYDYPWSPTTTTPAPDSQCAIKVFVNGEERTIGKSVDVYNAEDGTVLVFKHWHYGNDDTSDGRNDLNCINIVGSKGLSVSFCAADNAYYSNLYVWAMESLRQAPRSLLYGLCDTYTGELQYGYTMDNGTQTNDTEIFGESWKIMEIDSIIIPLPNLDRCTNATVLSEIEDQCEVITEGVCAVSTIWQCAAFISSCVYDLCRMPNRDLYAQGYAFHMQIHSHLAQ